VIRPGDRVLTTLGYTATVVTVAPKRHESGYLPVVVKYDPGQDGATLANIGVYPDRDLTVIPDEEVDDYA
jgi:hypothetical protein